MARNRFFFNLSEQLSGWRVFVITTLFVIGAGVLYYFNQLGQTLEDREKKYATLYAEAVRFFIEQGTESTCDYTFVSEVIAANDNIPVIIVHSDGSYLQINLSELNDSTKTFDPAEEKIFIEKKIMEMQAEHEPIPIDIFDEESSYLYYSSSITLKQLRFFPYILLAAFLIFGTLAFIAYSSSRKAEENRVWVGLAKETAHQLGTPISGLLGWIGVLRDRESFDQSIGDEMEKDIYRLETITTRFSNIGSVPTMKEENLGTVIEETLFYLKRRISTKVDWFITNNLPAENKSNINRHLIEWVIENLCKNAVDAMLGVGQLHVSIDKLGNNKVVIDVRDSGKGISKNNQRKLFRPGFSTKKRGWGLGLTLAKRIIETYHNGKLFILKSEIDKGTTFRVIL